MLKVNYHKFRKHLQSAGLLYAFWRGIKYFIFLIKRKSCRFILLKNTIYKGRIRIAYSDMGIKIFWNNSEVTKGAGLNVAINTSGVWTNSTDAHWKILKKRSDKLKAKVFYRDLHINHIWEIAIEDDQQISWQIKMEIEKPIHIDEICIACPVNHRYKTWINNYQQYDFTNFNNQWQDLCLNDLPTSLLGVRFPTEGEFLPSLALEFRDNNLLPFVKNAPLNTNLHVIGVRHTRYKVKEKSSAGSYDLFSGKICLFEDDSLLDVKIEKLRKACLDLAITKESDGQKLERRLKVVLVNLPWQRQEKGGVRAGSRWPHIKIKEEDKYLPFPFFLAYATSLLKKNNIQAFLIDAIAEQIPEDKFIEKISRLNFDLLVAETSTPSFLDDMRMLRKISSLGIPIALCGPHIEIYQPEFLKENLFINFILYGEYEFTLLELIENLQRKKDLSRIRGLIWRNMDGPIKNLPRQPADINLLPWPSREGLPMEKYLDAPGEMPTPSVQMLASRGCPFQCIFCLWPQVMYQGHLYRVRDVVDVVKEMEFLIKEMKFKSVYFDDDTFNIGKERMMHFCREIKNRGLHRTPWAIMARPDLMDEEILTEMKSAGLWAVKYGVESANQQLLDNIKKNMDLRESERMIKFTQRLGIRTHLTFTFGLPGETRGTMKKSINFAVRLKPFSLQFSITTPFPSTEYFDILDRKGLIISKNWPDYDGNFGSVMKLEKLSNEELESTKQEAYRIWADHLRRRRGVSGDIQRFTTYWRQRGPIFSIYKTVDYFNYIMTKRKRYLKGLIGDFSSTGEDRPLIKGIEKDPTADILLVLCPPWDVNIPPLGIAYLSTYLKNKGFKPLILDANIHTYNTLDVEERRWWQQNSYDWWVQEELFVSLCNLFQNEFDRLTDCILSVNTKYIGFSVNFANRLFTIELMKRIKKKDKTKRIILGGFGCINEHMRTLFPKELVDIFVIREGEVTLCEILNTLKSGHALAQVEGAVINNGDVFSRHIPRRPIMNLDAMPFPTFEEFYLHLYQNNALPLLISRGCIGRCTFCNDHEMSAPFRFRSAGHIVEEIRFHVKNHKITNFSFKDLLCNGNPRELGRICDLILQSGLKIKWDSQAIPKKDLSYDLLLKMKKAGCHTLIYGVESCSNQVLKKMGKYFTKEDVGKVMADTRRAGIRTFVNIIVGFPGESEDDFLETCNFLEENCRNIDGIGALSTCLVNNDTNLERHPQKYALILPEDARIRAIAWSDTNGNTLELRRERLERMKVLLSKVGLEYECSNASSRERIPNAKSCIEDEK